MLKARLLLRRFVVYCGNTRRNCEHKQRQQSFRKNVTLVWRQATVSDRYQTGAASHLKEQRDAVIEERERKQERARESNLQKEETRWQAAMQQHHMVCCYMCDVTFIHIYSYTHILINQYVHVYIYICTGVNNCINICMFIHTIHLYMLYIYMNAHMQCIMQVLSCILYTYT